MQEGNEPVRVIRFPPQAAPLANDTTTNKVVTSKYNVFSFLPIFLFEMFSRAAYLYFLLQVGACAIRVSLGWLARIPMSPSVPFKLRCWAWAWPAMLHAIPCIMLVLHDCRQRCRGGAWCHHLGAWARRQPCCLC